MRPKMGSENQLPVGVKALLVALAAKLAHETMDVGGIKRAEHFVDSAIDRIVSGQSPEVHCGRPRLAAQPRAAPLHFWKYFNVGPPLVGCSGMLDGVFVVRHLVDVESHSGANSRSPVDGLSVE